MENKFKIKLKDGNEVTQWHGRVERKSIATNIAKKQRNALKQRTELERYNAKIAKINNLLQDPKLQNKEVILIVNKEQIHYLINKIEDHFGLISIAHIFRLEELGRNQIDMIIKQLEEKIEGVNNEKK